jgi:hypothetical protein
MQMQETNSRRSPNLLWHNREWLENKIEDLEEERIRKSHFNNGVFSDSPSRIKELKSLFAGYSVDPQSAKEWAEENRDLFN